MAAPHNDWLVGICSAVFDIDEGQKLETIYPSSALSKEEATAVAFHAFPDSLSQELRSRSSIRDSTFFFRIRRSQSAQSSTASDSLAQPKAVPNDGGANGQQEQYSTYQQYPCLYGFVFCRQRQDERLRRGGEQKSVVVLALQPFSSIFGQLSHAVAHAYFSRGAEALEEAYLDVADWLPPGAEQRSLLTVGSAKIAMEVPAFSTMPAPAPEDGSDPLAPPPTMPQPGSLEAIRGAFFEVDVWTPLQDMVAQLWVLWELVVLAQPLLVLAPSPGEASGTVAALIALVTPMPYAADFRPFFTIHDPAFRGLAAAESAPGAGGSGLPRLLGVTNLYIVKALPSWPNVLAVGHRAAPHKAGAAAGAGKGPGERLAKGAGETRLGKLNSAVRRRAAGPQTLLTEHVRALWHAHKPLLRPDRAVLDRLVAVGPTDGPARVARAAANSGVLRAHFGQLTAALLDPFRQFFTPVAPPPGPGPVPASGPPHLPAFSHAAFLEDLKTYPVAPLVHSRFPNKGAMLSFYKRLLESPNWTGWFEQRRGAAWAYQVVGKILQGMGTGGGMGSQAGLWAEERAERGEQNAVAGLDEVKTVESFFDLECRLTTALQAAASSAASEQDEAHVAELRRALRRVFESMPRDLQQTMLSSPARAALLQTMADQWMANRTL